MRIFFSLIFFIILIEIPLLCPAIKLHTDFYSQKTVQKNTINGDFKTDFDQAKILINENQYQEALVILLSLVNEDSENNNLNFLIGYCYYNIEAERNKAVSYLEKAVVNTVSDYDDNSYKEKSAPVFAFFYLGKSYQWIGRLDAALTNYEKFRGFLVNKSDKLINQKNFDIFNDVNESIANVKTAKKLIANPLRLQILKVPLVNNNNYSCYGAGLSQDKNSLYYSRERLNDKIRGKSDMYALKRVGQNWVKNEQAGQNLNSPYNDIFNSISADNKFLLFSSDRKGVFNVFYAIRENNKWSEPLDNMSINSNYNETYAILSNDGNKIIFVSDKLGGFGGKDLYKIEKKPDGSWSQIENLGFTINTNKDEDTPWLSEDGNRLYFSSAGHNTIGGSDVFYSDFKNNIWLDPVNMGYPINSLANDLYFKYYLEDNLILLSSNRKTGGIGYEVLAMSYKDSTTVNELFTKGIELQADDSLAEQLIKPEEKPELKSEVKPTEISEVKPEEKPEEIPEVKPEIKPEEKPEEKPEVKPIEIPEVKPEVKPEEKPEVKPEVKPEEKPVIENPETVKLSEQNKKAIQDSILKVRKKQVSDSLENVRLEILKREMKANQNAANSVNAKLKQDSLAKAKEIERKKALADATRIKLQKLKEQARQDSIIRLQRQTDSLKIVAAKQASKEKFEQRQKLAQQKVDSVAKLANKTRNDSINAAISQNEKVKPTKEPEKESLTVQEPPVTDTVKRYTVQVGAGWMKIKYFKSIDQKKICYGPDGLARFIVGEYSTKKAAEEAAEQMRLLGFTDAWVAAIDDKRCAWSDNEIMVRDKVLDKTALGYNQSIDTRYTVQVGAGNMKIRYFKNLQQVKVCNGKDGLTRFTFGEFESLDDAMKVKNKIIKLGYLDAWTPEIDENRCGGK